LEGGRDWGVGAEGFEVLDKECPYDGSVGG